MATLPKGVIVDPVTGNYLYKGVIFPPGGTPSDIQNIVSSVDSGTSASYSIPDPVSGDTLKFTVNPASASADSIANYNNLVNSQPGISAVSETKTQPSSVADIPVNSAINPSGNPGPNTQVFDDGSTLQTFEDGSTLATATDGTTTSSPAPDEFPPVPPQDPTSGPVSPVGPAYDDDGNLLPGWSLDENNNPVWVGGDFVEPATQASADQSRADATAAAAGGSGSGGRSLNVPKGAMPSTMPGAMAQWSEAKDLRVKLRVPPDYLVGPAAGPASIIQKNGGILFPYTPTISVDNQANYALQNPLHSNYPLYFYKNSSVGPIQVTAKFTVQNEFEGAVLLGVIHLLRSLVKMKFGDDHDAGSPPPVCRFDAYGDYMMNNVPVSIASWRHELPDGVDYIAVGRQGSPTTYGHSMVPVMSSISLTLNVMYSRREMLAHNVSSWNTGGLSGRGYI